MDPHLLALASSGSFEELKSLLVSTEDGEASGSLPKPTTRRASSSEKLQTTLDIVEEGQASGDNGGTGTGETLPAMRRDSDDDKEANRSILLAGVTAGGDTALHVVAACGYGDGDNFLECARIIHGKARKNLLFEENKNGDTPLHCAARAGKFKMVKCLIDHLAFSEGGEGRMKELLRKQNKHKETALHEAVRVGNKNIVDLLMDKDSELASVPDEDGGGGGASPLYLAIVLRRDEIVKTLYEKTSSRGKLSFSGPNGQNALHAAVLRYQARDVSKLLVEWNKRHLCPQNRDLDLTTQRDENGSTGCLYIQANVSKLLVEWNKRHLCPQNKDLTTKRDENGSTPLHFAAAIKPFMIQFVPSKICRQVLEANPDALYQADHAGFFPVHVAASAGAFGNVDIFVRRYPGNAGLRDAKGRTFLHVAVEKKQVGVISGTCRNLSLSWIMNMVDDDGNTALHLAVQAGSLRMFCHLMANPQVNLNLPNRKGETPSDIAESMVRGFQYNQNSEVQIRDALRLAGAVKGARRQDHLLKDNKNVGVKEAHDDESKEMEVLLKDSAGTMCIGSVLIVTVTFGVTFAAPGGYIADDHNNGGTPILAPRYAFDAFIASNTLAFVFSAMATISLMCSGSPLLDPQSRKVHLGIAFYLLSISLTSLAAAFALGAYAVLAPVSHKTAVATCVLTSLVLLYLNVEYFWRRWLLLPPLRTRKGLLWACGYSAIVITVTILSDYWPLILIFGWATYAS